MKANVGGVDRVLRIVAGLGLLAWAFFGTGDAHWWGLIGIVPLVTGTFRFCPLYAPLGFNTCPLSQKQS